MWGWVVAAVTAIGIGEAAAISPREPRILSPNSYAQERAVISPAPTVIWSSAVGKGKTTGACMNDLLACAAVPGVRAALTRLERASMDNTTLETLQRLVGEELWRGQGTRSGWKESKSTLLFPPVRCADGKVRQSRIVAFGWIDPGRNLSSEFSRIVVDQAEQLEHGHYAIAQTRLRPYDRWVDEQLRALGLPVRQLLLICNADDPEHWLNLEFKIEERGMREEHDPASGRLVYEVILSQEDDNAENLAEYEERLGSLAGTVWWERLKRGRWARAEGTVYGAVFDPAVHLIPRPAEWAKWGGYPPPNWPRHRAFDFGVNHPFTVAWYAERPDHVLICYREGYGTGRAASEWATWILEQEELELKARRTALADEDEARALGPYCRRFQVSESWSDHDLEWRRELGRFGIWTQPARKDLEVGIQAMVRALRQRQLLYVNDLLVERDERLQREKLPTSVLQEYGRYKYPPRRPHTTVSSDQKTNVPIDRDNHGLDRDRYMVTSHFGALKAKVWA